MFRHGGSVLCIKRLLLLQGQSPDLIPMKQVHPLDPDTLLAFHHPEASSDPAIERHDVLMRLDVFEPGLLEGLCGSDFVLDRTLRASILGGNVIIRLTGGKSRLYAIVNELLEGFEGERDLLRHDSAPLKNG